MNMRSIRFLNNINDIGWNEILMEVSWWRPRAVKSSAQILRLILFFIIFSLIRLRRESIFELRNELDTWRGHASRFRDGRDAAAVTIYSSCARVLKDLHNLHRKWSKSLHVKVSWIGRMGPYLISDLLSDVINWHGYWCPSVSFRTISPDQHAGPEKCDVSSDIVPSLSFSRRHRRLHNNKVVFALVVSVRRYVNDFLKLSCLWWSQLFSQRLLSASFSLC